MFGAFGRLRLYMNCICLWIESSVSSVYPEVIHSYVGATGCGVPGVMASRTIENEKDRRMTAMLTTFMPLFSKTADHCSNCWSILPQ